MTIIDAYTKQEIDISVMSIDELLVYRVGVDIALRKAKATLRGTPYDTASDRRPKLETFILSQKAVLSSINQKIEILKQEKAREQKRTNKTQKTIRHELNMLQYQDTKQKFHKAFFDLCREQLETSDFDELCILANERMEQNQNDQA